MRIVNFCGIIFTFLYYGSMWGFRVKMMLTLMIIKCSYTNNATALIRWAVKETRFLLSLHSASCPRSLSRRPHILTINKCTYSALCALVVVAWGHTQYICWNVEWKFPSVPRALWHQPKPKPAQPAAAAAATISQFHCVVWQLAIASVLLLLSTLWHTVVVVLAAATLLWVEWVELW